MAETIAIIIESGYDIVDVSTISDLALLLQPSETRIRGESLRLHKAVASFLPKELKTTDASGAVRIYSEYISNDAFPYLLHSHIQNKVLKEEFEKKIAKSVNEKEILNGELKAAKDLIQCAVDNFPKALYDKMPHKKSLKYDKIDHAARQAMKGVIEEEWNWWNNKEKMRKIGITIPEHYANELYIF